MIFDKQIELELLENQPEWCGINDRIKEIIEKRNKLIARFDKEPLEWIQKAIEKEDQEIKFFQNILYFWASNYAKLSKVSEAVERQAKVANNGEHILSMIDDLRMAYTYQDKLDFIQCQTIIDLCKIKGKDTEKMEEALHKFKHLIKEYQKFMYASIDKEVKRVTNE